MPAATFLPAILPNPPIYSKVNPADTPVMTLRSFIEYAAAFESGRFCGYQPGAEDFAVVGRGPGDD